MDSPDQPGPSHSHSSDDNMAQGRKRVGFNTSPPAVRPSSSYTPDDDTGSGGHGTPLQRSDVSYEELREVRESLRLALESDYPETRNDIQKPRPAIRKTARSPPQFYLNDEPEDIDEDQKRRSGLDAQKRAAKLSKSVGTFSAPASRRNSQERFMSPPIELHKMGNETPGSTGDVTEDDEDDPQFMKHAGRLIRQHTIKNDSNVRPDDLYHSEPPLQSGQVTPTHEVEIEAEHVPRPVRYRTGVLGTLLKATNATAAAPASTQPNPRTVGHSRHLSAGNLSSSGPSTAANSPYTSPPSSGTGTPRSGKPWFQRHHNNHSVSSISRLVGTSSLMAYPGQKEMGHEMEEQYKKTRPEMGKRRKSDNSITTALGLGKTGAKARKDEELKIKIHLAGFLARQNYLRKLCKALMMYGAPTHRLEEYMSMSARILEIEAQFLYMPGCMIVAFDDSSVHTSEVKLVRTNQGIDLGKLRDVHEIYKDVVHDRIGVEEATPRLEAIIKRKHKFNRWLRVPMYGLASASVGPFAFQARPIDLPFCFLLGCIMGWLQLIVAPGNDLISNVLEIGATVITSFIARGIGSIPGSDGNTMFCFSAMSQSSIALILPGFTVLSASLELQSKHIVAGSVRMVYAIIYSLFLGFGITIGTVLFGLMYPEATSETECKDPMSSHFYYLFVFSFSICLMIINQAKYKQMPSMVVIALVGYVVNFHTSSYFQGNAQVSNTLGALAIGIAANLHARFGRHVENWGLDVWEANLRPRWVRFRKRWLRRTHGRIKERGYGYQPADSQSHSHSRSSSVASDPYVPHTRKIGYGLAAAAMLPAIFVQVPSGLSVQGSLISGLKSADQITRNTTGVTTVTADEATGQGANVNSVALNVGFSVIQIAIGITVGLFLAALIVYPFGKRRSGLFSF